MSSPLLPQLFGAPSTRKLDDKPVDLSIVIAHRGAALGLWATIHSCEIDLMNSGLTYNYIVVVNGEQKIHPDTANVLYYLDKAGKLRDRVHIVAPTSPPSARQYGAEIANGKYLFFFDNHVLVHPGYFKRAVEQMEKYSMDMLHSTTFYYMNDNPHYEYKLTLGFDFWGKSRHDAQNIEEPYRVAVGGHGGFVVRRDVWNEVGGYFEGFVGYGGEEVYFDLKMWLLGKSVWLDPKMIHYHFAGDRGYKRHYTDDYFRNMMMCAYIIGDHHWAHKVFESALHCTKQRSDKTVFDLMMEAEQRGRQHAQWLAERRTHSLDNLLSWFTANNISY